MKELLYTILEMEEWNEGTTCWFCFNKAVCQIRTRSKVSHKIIANDMACERCKEKFENDELPKCEWCGRLKNKHGLDILSGKHVCDCIRDKEDLEEKELPVLPHEERESTFYERQINSLRERERQLEEEVETHLEALEVSEVWNKRQKQELLDRIKELEAENKRLKDLTPQELLDEISKLKERVKQLEEQNNQFTAQIEVKEVKKWSWRLRK
jgi:DNA repair exonuclease SbcCD ATPase subunit